MNIHVFDFRFAQLLAVRIRPVKFKNILDKIACGAAIMLVQSMADSYMSDCMGKAFYCRLLGKSF